MLEYFNEHTDRYYRRLRQLMVSRLRDQLRPDQEQELQDWVGASVQNRRLFERLTDEQELDHHIALLYSIDEEAAWERIRERVREQERFRRKPARRRFLVGLSVAASMAVVVVGGITWFNGGDPQPVVVSSRAALLPGYASASRFEATLSTRKGERKQYQLPDGSRVWLNNESRLSWGPDFGTINRVLKLDGEAFFEVKHDSARPFRVLLPHQELEVLGTKFNVRAYLTDPQPVTSLLSGSLKVSKYAATVSTHTGNASASLLLKPGEQAMESASGKLSSQRIHDIEQVIAWRKNYLCFEHTPLLELMREVERWFDVRVVIMEPIEKHFNLVLRPSMDLPAFLRSIEVAAGLRCVMKGRTIYVSKE